MAQILHRSARTTAAVRSWVSHDDHDSAHKYSDYRLGHLL